ncbi:MAG: hypothetical protein ACON4Z_05120 [Planctomycetota bacterium]
MSSPPRDARAPSARWPLLYAVCCALAVLVMALLYWFTARFNLPLGG